MPVFGLQNAEVRVRMQIVIIITHRYRSENCAMRTETDPTKIRHWSMAERQTPSSEFQNKESLVARSAGFQSQQF